MTLTDDRVTLQLGSAETVLVPDAADDTWAKIRLDLGWDEVGGLLPRIEQPATRVVLVNAIRDAVRNAELEPAVALPALLAVATDDDEDVVVGSVLRFCTEVLATTYTPVTARTARMTEVHATAWQVVDAAGAGSDRQLLGFRYAIATSADTDQLRSWLDGRSLPAGLDLDPELVWALVVRLAEVGGEGEVIDRLSTATPPRPDGCTRHGPAPRCRSPRRSGAPGPRWSSRPISPPPSCTPSRRGSSGPVRPTLTAAYVPRFFTEMPATETFRSGWSLAQVVADGFPVAHATRESLALAEQTLAGDLPAAVRRSMTDGTDVLRRALASIERFS